MKAKKLSVKDMAILAVAAGFAWSKLGLGIAVAEVAPALVRPSCPRGKIWDERTQQCIPLQL